ncbi:MAG: sulfotransferase [Cyanobacteria bacterium P01_A01_bin.45]
MPLINYSKLFLDLAKPFAQKPSHLINNIIWRFPQNVSTKEHIFIIGAPRSGTTLLESILSVHPNFTSIEIETGIFTFRDIYTFTNATRNMEERQSIELILKDSKDIIDFYDRFTTFFLMKEGGKFFLEKTPQHILHLGFIKRYFPNARFINIYRDGRDCYCSARNNEWVIQGNNIERYAKYWRKCVLARLQEKNQLNILDVKYENLTSEPESTIKEIMSFLKEEYSPKQLNPQYYSQHKASKAKEFNKLSKPIDNSSQKRWIKELTNDEISTFNKIAGRELLKLGYPL